MRRLNVLQLNAVDLNAPLVGGIVEDGAQLGVDGVARGKRLIQLEFTDDVTQCGLRQLLDSVGQVIDLIHGLERVHNLEIQQCIDLGHYVILGNHVLLVEVVHLLTQVDYIGGAIASVLISHNALGAVDERDNDIDTWFEGGIILTQALNDLGLTLRNNHEAILYQNKRQQNNDNQENC